MLYRRILLDGLDDVAGWDFNVIVQCSVIKTKCGVARSRINESELKRKKKVKKVMDCRIKSGMERRSHYPVPSDVKVSKELEKTWGVEMV